jgi:hypothetical protein
MGRKVQVEIMNDTYKREVVVAGLTTMTAKEMQSTVKELVLVPSDNFKVGDYHALGMYREGEYISIAMNRETDDIYATAVHESAHAKYAYNYRRLAEIGDSEGQAQHQRYIDFHNNMDRVRRDPEARDQMHAFFGEYSVTKNYSNNSNNIEEGFTTMSEAYHVRPRQDSLMYVESTGMTGAVRSSDDYGEGLFMRVETAYPKLKNVLDSFRAIKQFEGAK